MERSTEDLIRSNSGGSANKLDLASETESKFTGRESDAMSAGAASEGAVSSIQDSVNPAAGSDMGSPTMSASSSVSPAVGSASASSSSSMSDTSSTQSDIYMGALTQIIGASKPEVAQSALKQIAKLLQAITKKPTDKKARQLRLDAFILKKYVVDLPHGLALMKSLGFREEKVDGKDCLCLDDNKVDVALLDSAAEAMCDPAGAQKQLKDRQVQEQKAAEVAASQPVRREPCKTGCGFYGDPSRQGYCSQCAKTRIPAATAAAAAAAASPIQPVVTRVRNAHQRWRYACTVTKAMHRFNLGKRPVQVDKERCFECNRKLGLSGFECRCQYVFCGKHRYPQEHDCRFDHKKRHMAELARVNQRVVASKIDKIDE